MRKMNKDLEDNLDSYEDYFTNDSGVTKIKKFYKYKSYKFIPEICNLLDKTKNIFVGCDWHIKRPANQNIEYIIRRKYNKIIKGNDVFIFLGDLDDPEYFTNEKYLKKFISSLNGIKILVLGNNDSHSTEFYLNAGFKYVVPNFVWKDLLFTHFPTEVGSIYKNIHGHIHGSNAYFNINNLNHRDAFSYSLYPIKLDILINKKNSSKSILSHNYNKKFNDFKSVSNKIVKE